MQASARLGKSPRPHSVGKPRCTRRPPIWWRTCQTLHESLRHNKRNWHRCPGVGDPTSCINPMGCGYHVRTGNFSLSLSGSARGIPPTYGASETSFECALTAIAAIGTCPPTRHSARAPRCKGSDLAAWHRPLCHAWPPCLKSMAQKCATGWPNKFVTGSCNWPLTNSPWLTSFHGSSRMMPRAGPSKLIRARRRG